MKNNEVVRIAIAETSVIIRGGLTAALKRLSNVKVQPIELLSVEALHDCVRTQCPEMLIVNPTFGDYFDVAKFHYWVSMTSLFRYSMIWKLFLRKLQVY